MIPQYNWIKPNEVPVGAEILSSCCGAPFDSDLCSICKYCHDHTGFIVYDTEGNELGQYDY